MQEKIYHHGLNNKVLTRAEQDEMFRELNRMQQDRMRHFAELLANEPRLVAQGPSGLFNLSALEERVHLPLHTMFAEKGRDPEGQLSGTLRYGGTVRGVVHRYPHMSDNLPKGTIKVDRSDVNVRVTHDGPNGDDWFRAMAFGLTMDQMGAVTLDSTPPEGSNIVVDYKTTGGPIGPQSTGRALRIPREPVWQSSQRDRAATSAPARKKLRSKTRAQKKARRKQR
ncbi:hypothetical protein HOT49_gp032 [Erwinia phage vB_EamM_Alexandra]|uniref:Uncharacterized protein n=1 Tax=Erwinia phage vB_EamM_Alexandra TaxID=2201424 RepID=A0A2Z4QDG7_9CAUD|nr:hypothetical protein HOT49_gp032 [Erwinia phage vB_EamM_Alexandra]AWY08312.1 hypothetical protein Alexandra_32 [Erwinia phage vB_EamM_Alexandra]